MYYVLILETFPFDFAHVSAPEYCHLKHNSKRLEAINRTKLFSLQTYFTRISL